MQKVQFPRPIRNERRKTGREEEEVEVKGKRRRRTSRSTNESIPPNTFVEFLSMLTMSEIFSLRL